MMSTVLSRLGTVAPRIEYLALAPGQIGVSDSAAVIGAWGASPNGNTNQGAAYFYSNDPIFTDGFD